MARAIYEGQVIAESNDVIEIEGRTYFPPESIKASFLKRTEHTSYCTYKGNATYYSVTVNGKVAKDAVWAYKEPKEGYEHIKNFGSFWNGVEVEKG